MRDLNVNELKQQLKDVGAKTNGNKSTLNKRLRLWQSGSLNRKLFTTTIVPPIDRNSFPQIDYKDLDSQCQIQRSNLQWLSNSIVSSWFCERKASVGETKGRNLFFNEFIKRISYIEDGNDTYFKGICSAETKKNVDYTVLVQLNSELCQIMKASCICPAGAGLSAACKHISALLYAIECFIVSGKVPTSSTSRIQKWHKPGGRTVQNMTVDAMLGVQESTYNLEFDITDYAINTLINFKTASPLLSSHNVNFTAYCSKHDYCAEKLEYYMLNHINKVSLKDIKRLEKNTRSHDKLWYKTRSSRITASICHNAIRTTNSGKFADSFLKKHIRCTAIFNNAIKWGLSHEATAKKKYIEVTGNQMEECGIFIHPDLNFLAATPDGINRTKNLIIEIKCPYSVRNGLPINAKYITKQGLLKTHAYFYQIQLQMCITGTTNCDFIVWTPQLIYVERIKYDQQFVDEMLNKLKIFYKKAFCESYFKYKLE